MLKVFLISSGVLPLIMLATVLQVTSMSPLMSRKLAARMMAKSVCWSTFRKSTSHSGISSDLFSWLSSNSGLSSSSTCFLHHSTTFSRIVPLTFVTGITSSLTSPSMPRVSSITLMVADINATLISTSKICSSLLWSCTVASMLDMVYLTHKL
ncbi:GSCOCG00010126001-RA-CDS [Cotesia congregata]|nr:GSCOCG00010126001-RA-CDS [Cotesia congregata]